MTWAERVVQEWDASVTETVNIRNPLVASLSRIPWDLFWTQTFRKPIANAWAARNAWCRSLAEWSSLRPVTAALFALEPHADYRSLHVHALLSMRQRMPLRVFRREWRSWKNWSWRTMGKALWLHVQDQTFLWYVTKYVTKMPASAHWMTEHQKQTLKENQWGLLTSTDIASYYVSQEVTIGQESSERGPIGPSTI